MRLPPCLLPVLLLLLPAVASAACSGEQSYVLSLRMSFTQNINPLIPPRDKARIPVVVAVSHKPNYHLFEPAKKLSDAAAEVASAGKADEIKHQFDILRETGDVHSFRILHDVPIDDISQLQLDVKDSASRISLMAQLSPSPSWFVGVDSFDLCEQSRFIVERQNIRVRNYNSGLDSSQQFAMSDPFNEGDTLPVELLSAVETDTQLATLSVKQGTLGISFWKIILGAVAAAVVVAAIVCVVIPLWRRRNKATQIPLTTQEGTEW